MLGIVFIAGLLVSSAKYNTDIKYVGDVKISTQSANVNPTGCGSLSCGATCPIVCAWSNVDLGLIGYQVFGGVAKIDN